VFCQLEKRLSINAAKIALFKDEKLTQPIKAAGTVTLAKVGLKNGDMLHVGNQDVELTSVKEAAKAAEAMKETIKSKEETKDGKQDEEMIDTSKKPAGQVVQPVNAKKPMTDEEYKKSLCRHGPNQKCVNCLGVTKENAETAGLKNLCQHPPGGKCPNCIKADE